MPEIEYLLLADHAEAANGKLTVMGAGWTDAWRVRVPDAPIPITHFGIGVSVLVPWTETNRPHHLVLRIEHEDGATEIGAIETDLEIGRPPGLPHGSDQRAVLAVNADIQFPLEGGWRVAARLGEQTKTASFRVHDNPPAAA